MKLKANRPLAGAYGYVPQGGIFDTDDESAAQLMQRGLAEPYQDKPGNKAVKDYETKVIEPEGSKAVKGPITTEQLSHKPKHK